MNYKKRIYIKFSLRNSNVVYSIVVETTFIIMHNFSCYLFFVRHSRLTKIQKEIFSLVVHKHVIIYGHL